ncbi:MAG: DEAD/DEAH box helicase [Planctomycetota bacterium]
MDAFLSTTRDWFSDRFRAPTEVQAQGWDAIARGDHSLLVAPTGSGKTLAAFLWAIDATLRETSDERGTRVVYISPLKALAHDIERNLEPPLAGVAARGARRLRVDVRTGDTKQSERRRQALDPAEILVTTPESLFLILGSKARTTLSTVHTVIVDEIHAVAGSKRGAHLALSLERLGLVARRDPQRIGLSATARPLETIAAFLGGDRPVTIVDASTRAALELEVRAPGTNRSAVATDAPSQPRPTQLALERSMVGGSASSGTEERGIWATLVPQLLDSIRSANSTIVFVNARAAAERLTQRLNELAGTTLARAHHGSVSHAERRAIEHALERGEVRAIVATSSLELGIDMSAVDQVLLVETPISVASGLQRVGRAGHAVGATSRGVLYPKYAGDLLEASVVAARMLAGAIEAVRPPENPLDVLSQQIVAMVVDAPRSVAEIQTTVRRARPFRDLPESALRAVLDMLAGNFPSNAFAELTPRLAWDRATDTLTARRGAALVTRLSGGTIPDRGAFPVVLGEGGPRVGELDEEMVYESKRGDVFLLGATSWRIEAITRDRIVVSSAPGEPGRMPFWKGAREGRDTEVGRAIGAFTRELGALDRAQAIARAREYAPLTHDAAEALVDFVHEQRTSTGCLPTDRAITIERFRDELGDWRVCVLTPLGGRVHAPWALAIEEHLSRRHGVDVSVLVTDDGIALRYAESAEPPAIHDLLPDADEVEELVVARLARSSLFASLFRENAVRSLLIPRRRPEQRNPLWAQRLKAKHLLSVVTQYPDFPIVLETYRHALADVFDLGALQELLNGLREGRITVDEVDTQRASPFARSLVFAFVASYLYETDAPGLERRAQALNLDRALLAELLGHAELRELLDADAIDEVEASLTRRADERRARDHDELHDLLRRLGDLSLDEVRERAVADPAPWLERLVRERRAVAVTLAGEARWIAAEDAGLFRDLFDATPPLELPPEYRRSVPQPFDRFLRRWACTHGPFTEHELARRYALPPVAFEATLAELERAGALVRGELRPTGRGLEWCDADVLRRIKRVTLVKLRGRLAAVDAPAFARFLGRWHGVAGPRARQEPLEAALVKLEGVPLPWSALTEALLPARVDRFARPQLDALGASGFLVWVGRGALGARDGQVALYRRERFALLFEEHDVEPLDGLEARLFEALDRRGASFLTEIERELRAADVELTGPELEAALWSLVWRGRITNDTFLPLGALRGPKRRRSGGSVGGRWSTVRSLVEPRPSPTERALASGESLLARHGVVARATAVAEELVGGFSALRRALDALEEVGRVRRGWFVEGLGGAQFALAGALERLRLPPPDPPDVVVLAALDPAQPYGALLPWPARAVDGPAPRRIKGAHVALLNGAPIVHLAPDGRRWVTFPSSAEQLELALARLAGSQRPRGDRPLFVTEIDGVAATSSPLAALLERVGFERDHRGFAAPVR